MNCYHDVEIRIETTSDKINSWSRAFTEGFTEERPLYDNFKIVTGAYCQFELLHSPFEIRPRNLVVVFYRHDMPVRLFLANCMSGANQRQLIDQALTMPYRGVTLGEWLGEQVEFCGNTVDAGFDIPADAYSAATQYDVPVRPVSNIAELGMRLREEVKMVQAMGNSALVPAQYILRADFQAIITVETDDEAFSNSYKGALVCQSEEAIYPLLAPYIPHNSVVRV